MVPKDTRQQFPPSLESRPLARASRKPHLPRRCLRAVPCSSRAQTLPSQLQEPPVPPVSQTLSETRIHRELLHIPRLSGRHGKQDVSRTRASSFSYTPPPCVSSWHQAPPAACDIGPHPRLHHHHIQVAVAPPRPSPAPPVARSCHLGPACLPRMTAPTSLSFWARFLTGPRFSHLGPTVCLEPSSSNPAQLLISRPSYGPYAPSLQGGTSDAQAGAGAWWPVLEAPSPLHQAMCILICYMICLAPVCLLK